MPGTRDAVARTHVPAPHLLAVSDLLDEALEVARAVLAEAVACCDEERAAQGATHRLPAHDAA